MDGPAGFSAEIAPEESDFVAAALVFYRWRYWWLRLLLPALYFSVSLVSLTLVGSFSSGDIAVAVMASAMGVWLNSVIGKRRVRRLWMATPLLRQPFSLVWSASGFELSQQNGQYRNDWSEFVAWIEDDRVIVLPISRYMYRYLPKRCLSTEQVESLRRFVVRPA